MPPTRTGTDVERSRLYNVPGVMIDADGNPLGSVADFGLSDDDVIRPTPAPARPNRPRRGRNALSRGLRGLAGRLLGN